MNNNNFALLKECNSNGCIKRQRHPTHLVHSSAREREQSCQQSEQDINSKPRDLGKKKIEKNNTNLGMALIHATTTNMMIRKPNHMLEIRRTQEMSGVDCF
jgi:hypothetical protein